jgi:hypothetical protein
MPRRGACAAAQVTRPPGGPHQGRRQQAVSGGLALAQWQAMLRPACTGGTFFGSRSCLVANPSF